MNASQFLADRGRAVPTHPVVVRLLDPTNPTKIAEAPAVLRFVPERLRLAAEDAAAESLAKLKIPATLERRAVEEAYHFLIQAVREADAPASNFFETVEQCKSMLVDSEAIRLRNEYERYKDTNFPESFTKEEAQKIADEARNFTLVDLLQSRGYWQILRALPSLAVTFGASLMPGFSSTPSVTT